MTTATPMPASTVLDRTALERTAPGRTLPEGTLVDRAVVERPALDRIAPGSGRIAVALSGGVDSSVAAALLVERGHDVVGVHMKLHDLPDADKHGKACCSLDDSLDARQVCARLGIPFYVIDFSEPFRRHVMDYFVEAYRAGRTPNPCVMCNQHVKHAALLQRVREFGCEYLATGHYAGIRLNPDTGEHEILRPRDRRKDQTYFLFGTAAEELPYLIFPLAELDKAETRASADRRGFSTWNKPDSQEICFVPRDYRDFVGPRLGAPSHGHFVDRGGRVLGEHEGVAFYTIGQRRGLGIAAPRPLFVTAIRPERNEVVLGPEEELLASSARVSGVNWLTRPIPRHPVEAWVKIRYADPGTPARIVPAPDSTARIEFARPVRAITPGQAAVFYSADRLLGGGWIEGT
jgi:tRNA-specific 2-thiouridylase